MVRDEEKNPRLRILARFELPAAGPLFLTVLLVTSAASIAVTFARWNYTTLVRPAGDVAHTVLFKSDDSLWIRSRPELDQYYPGISTWPHTFTDLFEVWLHAFDANPYTAWILSPSIYPPLVHLVVKPFEHVSWAWFLAGFLALAVIGWFVLLRRILVLAGCPLSTVSAVVLVFFALPIPFALDRGNVEVFVALLVAISIPPALAARNSKTGRAWPIIIAAFLKATPIVMLAVVRWRARTVWQVLLTTLVCGIGSIASLMIMDGNPLQSARAFVDLSTSFGDSGTDPFVFRSTLWGTSAAYASALGLNSVLSAPGGIASLGLVVVAAVAAALLPFHLWERIAVVGSAMVLLSADGPAYRLLYVLIAAAVFLGVCWYRRDAYAVVMAVLIASTLAFKPWIPETPWLWTLLSGSLLMTVLFLCLAVGFVRVWRFKKRLPSRMGEVRSRL